MAGLRVLYVEDHPQALARLRVPPSVYRVALFETMSEAAREVAEAALPEKPAEAGSALVGAWKPGAEAPGNPGPKRAEAR